MTLLDTNMHNTVIGHPGYLDLFSNFAGGGLMVYISDNIKYNRQIDTQVDRCG